MIFKLLSCPVIKRKRIENFFIKATYYGVFPPFKGREGFVLSTFSGVVVRSSHLPTSQVFIRILNMENHNLLHILHWESKVLSINKTNVKKKYGHVHTILLYCSHIHYPTILRPYTGDYPLVRYPVLMYRSKIAST